MTRKQAGYLKSLCIRRGRTFDVNLTVAEASELISELSGKRRRTPPSREAAWKALKVSCPRCYVPAGISCKRRDGSDRKSVHAPRMEAARTQRSSR